MRRIASPVSGIGVLDLGVRFYCRARAVRRARFADFCGSEAGWGRCEGAGSRWCERPEMQVPATAGRDAAPFTRRVETARRSLPNTLCSGRHFLNLFEMTLYRSAESDTSRAGTRGHPCDQEQVARM